MDEIASAVASSDVVYVSGIAGGFSGVKLKDDIGKAWWEAGRKPRLISKG